MSIINKSTIFLKLSLIFNSFDIVGKWWNFKEVISPFSRIYLITEGEGWIFMNNQEYHLIPGKLLLIPKFTFHSYKCDTRMGHYYLCFLDEMTLGTEMYEQFRFDYLVDARLNDNLLFERLNILNPNHKIVNPDPVTYNNYGTTKTFAQQVELQSTAEILETQGIMIQLTSRFVHELIADKTESLLWNKRLNKVTEYINENLQNKISLNDLASIAYLSPDYFSLLFKKTMGVRPMEYLNRKRIERAQTLLLTTNFSITEISERVGILSNTYFSTIFKKHTLQTPESYKKQQQNF